MDLDAAVARLRRWVPRWWAGQGGAIGAVLDPLLWPAELAYKGVTAIRNGAFDRGWRSIADAPIPVISIGNIGVGGAGKTPVAAWVAERLSGWGHRPALVLRGYGHDEVLVHRELNPDVPVLANADRLAAVNGALRHGSDVAILDDGFQHRRLRRDLDVVLLSAETWCVTPRLLPRGPWRESLDALRRADLVVVTSKSAEGPAMEELQRTLSATVPDRPILGCRIAPAGFVEMRRGAPVNDGVLGGESVLAVAALAWPDAFAENLRGAGAAVELAAYPDHHEFTAAEAEFLVRRAAGRKIVMTLKDAVKLRHLLPSGVSAYVLRQRVTFVSGEDVIEAALRRVVRGRSR